MKPRKLPKHLKPVLAALRRRKWITALELSQMSGVSPFSITARVRDLRKPPFNLRIETLRFDGLYHYHLER